MNRDEAYRAGMSAYQEGRYRDAIDCLEQLAQQLDTTAGILSRFYLARAHYEVAMAMFQNKRFPDAAHHFRMASELSPEGMSVGRYLAACYAANRQYSMASIELERILERRPADTDARVRLALICRREGLVVQGMSVLIEGLRFKPDDPELHYQLGVLHASVEEWTEAGDCFARALQLDETHAPACERMAQCCSVQGRHGEALHFLERANRADPSDARIAWQLCLLAPQKSPHADPVRLKRMGTVEHQRVEQAAIERLSHAILDEPEFVESFLSLPETHVDGEVFALLAGTLEHALAAQPQYADLHYHCGSIYRRLGSALPAITHVEQAVSINPRYIDALILLARLYGETDRCDEGITRLFQAIEAGGDYPDVHFLLGRLAQRAGRMDLARASYETALAHNQSYHEAAEALAALSG